MPLLFAHQLQFKYRVQLKTLCGAISSFFSLFCFKVCFCFKSHLFQFWCSRDVLGTTKLHPSLHWVGGEKNVTKFYELKGRCYSPETKIGCFGQNVDKSLHLLPHPSMDTVGTAPQTWGWTHCSAPGDRDSASITRLQQVYLTHPTLEFLLIRLLWAFLPLMW